MKNGRISLKNYAMGSWIEGSGSGQELVSAIDGRYIAHASSEGLDFQAMLAFARKEGGPALRKLSFQERGRMLKALALYLSERKEAYYPVSFLTGATRADSWVDIDGGIGTLFAYSSLRRKLPAQPYIMEGETAPLSKSGRFIGHHLMVPKEGVAIHINAFNFPVWGMLEKISVNLLAGVPAIVKPATHTAYLAAEVVRDIAESGILPIGALQLVCGPARNLLDGVMCQDVVTFTGSASTGKQLKVHPAIIEHSVPFNMEADSLNACVLGPDAHPGTANFDLFIKEVHREMTAKCGQKCTAIRRAIVPENLLEEVLKALQLRLDKTSIGDPHLDEVRMGALAGQAQREEVRSRIAQLASQTPIAYGDPATVRVLGADPDVGAFIAPVLLVNEQPFVHTVSHEVEAFGPVCTVMPYKELDEAIDLCKLGRGSLVSSIATGDGSIAKHFALGAAAYQGRILVLDESCARDSTGHGSPMPLLVHGGPGRAGGGEEMGGLRGLSHYLQRTAIQGSPDAITAIGSVFQQGSNRRESEVHLFRKYFEELAIGDSLITAGHTVTESDINLFAAVSGDHFYAHMDATALSDSVFTGRVAHGYFILSKAAGLFVDAKKGPVLLNYGLDECRFTKPVYPGTTIRVTLTVKEKIDQDQALTIPAREGAENEVPSKIPCGIVRWLVDVTDQSGETVAIATILTMIRKRQA
ncbi:MAG: phenylacetic acid degradation bifunctional protein PaaZ [Saprospiraceae bacterium]|nr:phenylacetic acid degradation bifunctional protein PaaZ [Saprospiraceae bacterium]